MTWSDEDWRRLGDYFRTSRRSAGYATREKFAEAVGISSKTYGDIEAGRLGKRKAFSFDTIASIEEALGWHVGVSRSVLNGDKVNLWTGELVPGSKVDDSVLRFTREIEDESALGWIAERVESLEHRLFYVERLLHLRERTKEGGTSDVDSDVAQKSDDNNVRHLPDSPAAPARVTKLGTGGQDKPEPSEADESLEPAADTVDPDGDEKPGGSDDRG